MGNLGKACAKVIRERPDFKLVGTFERNTSTDIYKLKGAVDVVLVCVGSQADAPALVPGLAKDFSTVDSYDNHKDMARYIAVIAGCRQAADWSKATKQSQGHVNICGVGWDPGLFSLLRIYLTAFFDCEPKTFWGPGVSLGHTNAVKQIPGVRDAVQFTVPIVRENRHRRVVHVVADPCDHARIEHKIKTMPDYFAPYETEVRFVPRIKKSARHGGFVIAKDAHSSAQFRLRLRDNSRFTAAVMVSYAAANYRLQKAGKPGVYTAADIAPKYLLGSDVSVLELL